MAKIAEYKQIDTQEVEREVFVPATYDDDGNITTDEHYETRRFTEPVMGLVYREETEEETAERERSKAEIPAQEPTAEERIAELESQNAMLLECVLEMSEIIYA